MNNAVVPCVPIYDTVKHVEDGFVAQTLNRDNLWRAQTPQGFWYADLMDAFRKSKDLSFTDEATMMEHVGFSVLSVMGTEENFKITDARDYETLQRMIGFDDAADGYSATVATKGVARSAALGAARDVARGAARGAARDIGEGVAEDFLAGSGWDVHAFDYQDRKKKLILCGVEVPNHAPLKGHSDADVVLHAVTDAILGAIGEGDIGMHFSDKDPKWKNQDSELFVSVANDMLLKKGGRIVNVDITIICETPKLKDYREAMKFNLARILGLSASQINIKGKTTEGLGFLGRKEGIASQAVVSVAVKKNR